MSEGPYQVFASFTKQSDGTASIWKLLLSTEEGILTNLDHPSTPPLS